MPQAEREARAPFYGEMWGRTSVSTTGTKNGGIEAHIRGENVGVRVHVWRDSDGRDCIQVSRTGGSQRPMRDESIVRIVGDQPTEFFGPDVPPRRVGDGGYEAPLPNPDADDIFAAPDADDISTGRTEGGFDAPCTGQEPDWRDER